jgi:hypothetical protein
MAGQLKNILLFVNLAPGASQSLAHGLNNNFRKLVPDILTPNVKGVGAFSADDTNVTLFNSASYPLTIAVLCEAWHTIERAFGPRSVTALAPQPFVDGASSVAPPFNPSLTTIYARTTGSDTTGNGSLLFPYATFQRAVRDVPAIIPPGSQYNVDITGITEILPANYTLPSWKSAETLDSGGTGRFFQFQAAVNIQADLRNVQALSTADATVAAADVVSTAGVADPISGLLTYTLVAPRASWAANALKGKFFIQGGNTPVQNCVIASSTNTTIEICSRTALTFTNPANIMEPSAYLSGTFNITSGTGTGDGFLRAMNCDSVGFNGIDMRNVGGINLQGLAMVGNGNGFCNLCVVPSINMNLNSRSLGRILRCWVQGQPVLGGYMSSQFSLYDAVSGANTIMAGAPGCAINMRNNIFDGCVTLEPLAVFPGTGIVPASIDLLDIDHCIIRNTPGVTGDGVRFYGGRGRFTNLNASGCGRDGVRAALGSGFLELQGCGSTVANGVAATGYGINVQDGLFVTADAATNTTQPTAGRGLTGAAGDTKTGNLATQTWAAFVAAGKNTYDITAVAGTGATGTGSRLYQ